MTLTIRPAVTADIPALRGVMAAAIDELQRGFLTEAQIVASHGIMGLDMQLVTDGTYLVVEADGLPAGCGGWSWRATLFGGDDGVIARDRRSLDPASEPARIRAMYTHPAYVRQGVGRLVIDNCEAAAAAHGFVRAELMATLAGEPFYRSCGYRVVERTSTDGAGGVTIPLIRMDKPL